jgi:hypothetical protein
MKQEIQEWEKDFNAQFMNNGVDGILDDKFQDQQMLLVKSFISKLLKEQEERHKREIDDLLLRAVKN